MNYASSHPTCFKNSIPYYYYYYLYTENHQYKYVKTIIKKYPNIIRYKSQLIYMIAVWEPKEEK